MKATVEKVNLSLSTKGNSLPTSRAVAGRLRLTPDFEQASFVEENGTFICGEPKSRRVLKGKNCSVWYNPEKERYVIRVCVEKDSTPFTATCDFEECLNFLKRRITNETK